MPILPAERDPRLITMRRGGTLTDEHHRQLAEWAALCAEHVLHPFEQEQPRDTRPRDAIDIGRSWIRGEVRMRGAHQAAFVANAAAHGLPDPAKFAALAAGQAVAAAHVAAHDLGAAAYAIRAVFASAFAVRQSQPAFGNETGSEKEFPRRFESWSLMTSSVEAQSAGTSSTTDLGHSSSPTPTAADHAASASRSHAGRRPRCTVRRQHTRPIRGAQ
jgi:hypothetical protein